VVCFVSPVTCFGDAGASIARTQNEGAPVRCVKDEDTANGVICPEKRQRPHGTGH
jgi:hypothetical protein